MTADVFGKTDQLDAATLDAMVARFEARGKHAAFAGMLTEYLDAMQIAPSANVLDLGCGTGLVARAIARHASFTGSVAGIDLSPHLVAAATRLADAEGISARATFQSGDARKLPFADASFDAVVAHTLISHVNAPLAVLTEAGRVLKPGGTIAVFDGDYGSLSFDQPDEAKARSDDAALVRAVAASRVPTLVAIGHEVDISLAELAADQRASTPSNAAELLVPDRREVLARLRHEHERLTDDLLVYLDGLTFTLRDAADDAHDVVLRLVANQRALLTANQALAEALNPGLALRRGFAIVRRDGRAVRGGLRPNDIVDITLDKAVARARIEQSEGRE